MQINGKNWADAGRIIACYLLQAAAGFNAVNCLVGAMRQGEMTLGDSAAIAVAGGLRLAPRGPANGPLGCSLEPHYAQRPARCFEPT
ncbi:MAG: hypothetical protein EOO40_01110 [Deltaproteobacteria bacterium]|nr:MAG: hypothetical protein EOO40_01110 [Deltaproteobacteria bacterium]